MGEKLSDCQDKVTEISLRGETYRLIFDFNALCRLEDIELDIKGTQEGKFSFRLLRAKLWAGLQRYHPEIATPEMAGDLIPTSDFMRISAEVGEAFLANMPQPKKGEGPADRTGPSSTTSAAGTSERTSSGDQPPAS